MRIKTDIHGRSTSEHCHALLIVTPITLWHPINCHIIIAVIFFVHLRKATGLKHCTKQGMTAHLASYWSQRC